MALFTGITASIFSLACSSPLQKSQQVSSQQAELLSISTTASRNIDRGQTHTYQFELPADRYFRIFFDPGDMAISLSVSAPDGAIIRELDCRNGHPMMVSGRAVAKGRYLVKLRSLEKVTRPAAYQLRIHEIRDLKQQDQLGIDAEIAVAEGDKLMEAWDEHSSRLAMNKFVKALAVWQCLDDREQTLYTMQRIGEAHHSLSELGKALTVYDDALNLIEDGQSTRRRIDLLNLMSITSFYQEKREDAYKYSRLAFDLSRCEGYQAGEAMALNNLGEYYYWQGDSKRALEFYEKALLLCQTLDNRRLLAYTFLNFGYSQTDLGNTREAFDNYDRALRLWQETGHKRGEALTLTARGQLHSRIGEKQDAIDHYNRARLLFEQLGDRLWIAVTLNSSAFAYLGLGDTQRSMSNYDQALNMWKDIHYEQGVAQSYIQIGEINTINGDYQLALDNYQRALPYLDAVRPLSYLHKLIGAAYFAKGNYRSALYSYLKALPLYRKSGNRQGEAYLLDEIGNTYDRLNDSEKAIKYYRLALTRNQEVGDRQGESLTHFLLARTYYDGKDLLRALKQIETALKNSESLRLEVVSQELRTTYSANIHHYYQLYLDILFGLNGQCPGAGYDALALNVSERARARSLLDEIGESHLGILRNADPDLIDRERRLRQELNGKAERAMRLAGYPDEPDLAAAVREVDRLKAEYDDLLSLIRKQNPRYAALTQPQPLGLKSIQNSILDDDTILLEYSLGEERSYLWAVTKNTLSVYPLPSAAEIEKKARQLYDLIISHQPGPGETVSQRRERYAKNDAEFSDISAALSRMILGPVASQLGNKRLLLVAEGGLQYIPFAALPDPAAMTQPMIVGHEIVSLPSASVLSVMREERRGVRSTSGNLLLLSDPVFELNDDRLQGSLARPDLLFPRLLSSRDEAEAIRSVASSGTVRVVDGFSVNRAFVTGPELKTYRMIHFATHGIVDSLHPKLSGMMLSRYSPSGVKVDGFLTLQDIYNLNLEAELVVLSACETAVGKDIKGEGLIGLTRGFMYAGVGRIVASLWKVSDDTKTTLLMKEFYRSMLQDNLTPAAALRRAQIKFWRQNNAPFLWAAFVLQGEYN